MKEIMFQINQPNIRRKFVCRERLILVFVVILILFTLVIHSIFIIGKILGNLNDYVDKLYMLIIIRSIVWIFMLLTTGLGLLYQLYKKYNYEYHQQRNTILLFLLIVVAGQILDLITLTGFFLKSKSPIFQFANFLDFISDITGTIFTLQAIGFIFVKSS